MKSNELRGTGDVFRFTLIQTLKSKAYIVSVVLLLVTAIFTAPVMQLIKSGAAGNKKVETSNIKKAYVCNELPFLLEGGSEITDLSENEVFKKVEFEVTTETFDALSERLEKEGDSTSVIVHPYLGVQGVTVEIVRLGGGDVKGDECSALADVLCEKLDQYKKKISGLSEEELKILAYDYEVEINYITPEGELTDDADKGINGGQFGVVYFIMFAVSMICIMASTQVATAVVTDKSSRVVELLLTSVRPMALLLGKILAMLVATIGQMVILVCAVVISNKLTGMLFNTESTYLTSLIPKGILSNLTVANAVVSFTLIALGLVFYATLAGLCGAMVSKMEELQESLKYFTTVSILGMYAAIAAIISMQKSATNIFVKFCELFPLTSPMTTPGARIINVAPMSYALIAIAILLVLDYLTLRFAAGVYEGLITNMGNPIKLKDVIAMARNKKSKGGAD
ncbi:MAG: ABC transporter permease [Lachnospiraceae bacterium]|nr:ABC transporter permease [Lachnospiraceae bacterium]